MTCHILKNQLIYPNFQTKNFETAQYYFLKQNFDALDENYINKLAIERSNNVASNLKTPHMIEYDLAMQLIVLKKEIDSVFVSSNRVNYEVLVDYLANLDKSNKIDEEKFLTN